MYRFVTIVMRLLSLTIVIIIIVIRVDQERLGDLNLL